MSTIADLVVKVGGDVSDVESEIGGLSGFVDENFAAITAAGIAAGAGLEAFARKNAPLNEGLRRTSAALGISEDAMRELALETSNVTFPLDEVIDLFETGRKQGLKSADQLQDYATFWDTVGDATGESATELGKAGAALRAVGIDAGNEADALGAFGYITDNTTGSVGSFLKFLDKAGPELREMGADVDDAAAILGVLESEFGMSAKTARTEFQAAVREADGDMGAMLDTLGISSGLFDEYRGAVDASSDVIQRNADIHADSYTPIQQLQHAAEELMFKFGGLADVAGMLALPLMALGPAAKLVTGGFGMIMGVSKGLIAGIGAVGKAFLVLGKILLANPWVLVAAAIIALVVVVVKNWDKIKKVISKAWEFIKSVTSTVWNAIKNFITNLISTIGNVIKNGVTAYVNFWRQLPGRVLSAISSLVSRVTSFFGKVISGGRKAFSSGVSSLITFVRGIPRRIIGAIPNPGSMLLGIGKAIIQGLMNGIKNMMGGLGKVVGGIGGFIKNLKGPLPKDRKMLIPEGKAIMGGLIGSIRDSLPGLRAALQGVNGQIRAGVDADVSARVSAPPAEARITLAGDGSARADFIIEEVRRAVEQRGGNVQTTLGRRQ